MKIAPMALDAPTNASTSRPSSTLLLLRRLLEDCEGIWGYCWDTKKILTILDNNKKI